jgi:signal transduction histidine kinase
MGLGLAISRFLVRAHGGSIEASARPEGGAVFSFWLPAAIVQT